jgi:hypothetical protein
MEIILRGLIKIEPFAGWQMIKLLQKSTYKIDLIGRFKEIIESFPHKEISIEYFIDHNNYSLKGIIEAGYEKEDDGGFFGADYYSTLTIGNYDLFEELVKQEGKYLIINIFIHL